MPLESCICCSADRLRRYSREATLNLATAPKSNSAGAYFKAVTKLEEVSKIAAPNLCRLATAMPRAASNKKQSPGPQPGALP